MQALGESKDSLTEVPRAQRRPLAATLATYVRAYDTIVQRNADIIAAWQTGDFTMQAISQAFDIHYATVSRVVSISEKGLM